MLITCHLSNITDLLFGDGLCFFNIKTMQINLLVRIDILIDFVENLPCDIPSNFILFFFVFGGVIASKSAIQFFKLVISILIILYGDPFVSVHHDLTLLGISEGSKLKIFQILLDVVRRPKSNGLRIRRLDGSWRLINLVLRDAFIGLIIQRSGQIWYLRDRIVVCAVQILLEHHWRVDGSRLSILGNRGRLNHVCWFHLLLSPFILLFLPILLLQKLLLFIFLLHLVLLTLHSDSLLMFLCKPLLLQLSKLVVDLLRSRRLI